MGRISKEKQAETLLKMQKVRYDDTLFLRDIIAKKLAWSEKEQQKGIDNIKQLENQLLILRKNILRLEGCIIVLKEISIKPKSITEQKKNKE